ncbi:MAG TPA: dUTP diphosphatase [bacterium (Candidatus Stahlbacteria)]|nr:dUTP diphosphatase [Candidatus Stahlbacteria bacterium]
MDRVIVRVEGGPLPTYATEGSVGADLYARVGADLTIPPGGWRLIPTGVKIQIPKGYEGQIRPRSGLALKHGITILNSPGTIDSDYRGEIKIILFNFGKEDFLIHNGDRIGQLVISRVVKARFVPAKVDDTDRGGNGFGSSGG